MSGPRKKKLESQARGNVLRIRLTDEERTLLDQAAETKTLDTSTWARSELIALAKKALEETGKKT
jgi:uncharacterized protein (DUF1778 family)